MDLKAVVLSSGKTAATGRTCDVSLSGARLSGLALDVGAPDWRPSPLDPEAIVWLSLECPDVPLPIALRARVVWRRKQDLGLAFISPPAHTRERLFRLVGAAARLAARDR